MTRGERAKFNAIIFDFDGVIADSEVLLNQALADGLTTASHIQLDDAERLRAASAHTMAEDYEVVANWIGL